MIATGAAEAHHEHIYGSRKPALWWIFFGRQRVRLPINVYVIEHEDGLMLFDAHGRLSEVFPEALTSGAGPSPRPGG